MQLTLQNGIARAVFLNEPTVTIVSRTATIKIELSKKAKVVAARFQSKADAVLLIDILRSGYNMVLSDQDKTTLLNVKF